MKRTIFAKIIASLALIASSEISFVQAEYYPPVTISSPREDISEEAWDRISPYLLPDDFEIKPILDEIFSKKRVILNSKTLLKAGFTNGKERDFSLLVVTKHPKVQGYIFKIYLDDQKHKSDEKAQYYFIKRIRGSLAIQEFIDVNGLQDIFKVPKKWVYLLPETSRPSKNYSYKNFILVEEDMEILDKDANKKAWKSSFVTERTLFELYRILKDIGLIDCAKIDNIPFSKDGRIAFIDTESFGHERVPLIRLKKVLSSKMRHFWKDLIRNY